MEKGANLGWIRVMGPLARVADFKAIETSTNFFDLQQIRWSPTNIVDTPQGVLDRLFMVNEGGDEFAASLSAAEEVPVNPSTAAAAKATPSATTPSTMTPGTPGPQPNKSEPQPAAAPPGSRGFPRKGFRVFRLFRGK